MLPTLMVIIDTSVVNVSLDHIRGSLSAGVDESLGPSHLILPQMQLLFL